jgi:hypothetical protein
MSVASKDSYLIVDHPSSGDKTGSHYVNGDDIDLSPLLQSENFQSDPSIIIDLDDENNFAQLTEWMVKVVEIVPSLARKYSQLFLSEGIGSISRLKKRLKKDPQFLKLVGIKDDDVEEILLALDRSVIVYFTLLLFYQLLLLLIFFI